MKQRSFKKFLSGKTIAAALILSLVLMGTATSLMAGKSSSKGYLGVNIEDISPEKKEALGITHGVLVVKVVKGEAAEKAGIKKGDVIQFFNGEKIRKPGDLVDAVRDCKPETRTKVKLVRDGKTKGIAVTLGKLKSKSYKFDLGDHKGHIFMSGKRGYLGVYLQPLNKDLAEYFGVKADEGVLIFKVVKEGPAEKAGLKAGDVIVQMGDKKVSKPGDVTDILSDMEKGDKAALQVVRHKKKKTLKVEVGEKSGLREIELNLKKLEKLKKLGELGKEIHIKIPRIHIDSEDEDHIIIMKSKSKCSKKKEEKEKKIEKKLKKVKEPSYL